jgi:hypothetical protein
MKEAFDGELFAIWMAVKKAVKMQAEDTTIVRIYTDSQIAMEKVREDTEGPGQAIAREVRKCERMLRPDITLEYCWVPAHEGVVGNELADDFAKRGASRDPKNKYKAWTGETSLARVNRIVTEHSHSVARRDILKMLEGHKAYRLKRRLGMRIAFKPGPGKSPPKKIHSGVFLQMACGHALIGAYLERFKLFSSCRGWWCR